MVFLFMLQMHAVACSNVLKKKTLPEDFKRQLIQTYYYEEEDQ